MIDLVQLQKIVYQNKIEKGFNVTDIYQEFCLIQGNYLKPAKLTEKRKTTSVKNWRTLPFT